MHIQNFWETSLRGISLTTNTREIPTLLDKYY